MQKGVKTRFIIHQILCALKSNNLNFDEAFKFYISKHKLILADKKMIHNIVLSTMRYELNIKKIIKKYIKKNITDSQHLVLSSAITQLIYLDFKEYAVVNSTVELAKLKSIRIFPGFINAVLKNILKDRNLLKLIVADYNDLPKWFVSETNNWTIKEKQLFLKTIMDKPDLNIVFKNNDLLKNFKYVGFKTSQKSMIVDDPQQIDKLPQYQNGDWWIQDYASMLPIHLMTNIKGENIIDMCAAPGGKTFQAISENGNVDIIEKNINRAKILKENLNRLKFDDKINILDVLQISDRKKYDIVLLDAPCSSVGTIRRNPEIFFRNQSTDIDKIVNLQNQLLNKAKDLVKTKGIILYMVCSFLDKETKILIDNFLENNQNFQIEKFISKEKSKELIDKNGYINIIPRKFNNFNIDGFFAAKLKKYD